MKRPALVLALLAACSTKPPTDQPIAADGGLPDASATDQSSALPPQAPPWNRCAAVGCARLPACPQTCQAPCGCCGCGVGFSECFWLNGKPAVQSCGASGGCYDQTPCPDGGECVGYAPGKAACVSSAADCGRVEAAYQLEAATYAALTAMPGATAPSADPDKRCTDNPSCLLTVGHCTIGLGACWYVGSIEQGNLDSLAKLWQRLGCARDVACDCPAMPAAGACSNGVCVTR